MRPSGHLTALTSWTDLGQPPPGPIILFGPEIEAQRNWGPTGCVACARERERERAHLSCHVSTTWHDGPTFRTLIYVVRLVLAQARLVCTALFVVLAAYGRATMGLPRSWWAFKGGIFRPGGGGGVDILLLPAHQSSAPNLIPRPPSHTNPRPFSLPALCPS